jgi:glycosyltransferase involved in cell wall biosynthesis
LAAEYSIGAGGRDGLWAEAAPADVIDQWCVNRVGSGRVVTSGLSIPAGPGELHATTASGLSAVLEAHGPFDQAVLKNTLQEVADPLRTIHKLFESINSGGRIVLVVPFGSTNTYRSRHAFYYGSIRRLLDSLFEIEDIEFVGGHIAVAGVRRNEPTGVPEYFLDADEIAFGAVERRLNDRLEELTSDRVRSGARYRGALARLDRMKVDLNRANRDLAAARQRLARLYRWLAIPIAVVRGVRRTKRWLARCVRAVGVFARPGHQPTRTGGAAAATPAAGQAGPRREAPTAAPGGSLAVPGPENVVTTPAVDWRSTLRTEFAAWLRAARAADGDEVVVMFSGTTFVQEHRGNRPIRLTNVYLRRRCPVFFNYYRWSAKDPLPEHPDMLLFQSPIDATPSLLDMLLTADFGGKKKILFASFPHEIMVRYLTVAAQHGWVTVYDARDDWEEFAKVGMAKWYHPGYERYIAAHADIATAVSRPLARKISALAGDRVVHTVPNGLDTDFPQPAADRTPARSPVIGYFGHLTDKWFDWPLVIAAAKRYPDYQFELAGHQAPELDLPPNVVLLGLLGHRELAERSRTWSGAVIPFKNGPLADAVDPIKVYEYLHLRLPVLATYFPQCRDYPGTTITESRDEFLDRLPELIGAKLVDDEISTWLADNTWERRVETYSALSDEVRRTGRREIAALLGGV